MSVDRWPSGFLQGLRNGLLLLILGSSPGLASVDRPACAGPVIAVGTAAAASDLPSGNAVPLEVPLAGSGASGVRLAGLAVPGALGTADRVRLHAELARLAGSPVEVFGPTPRLDRRNRAEGQVRTPEGWLQERLLREGLAVADGRGGPCAGRLHEAEADARRNRSGFWAAGPAFDPERVDGGSLPDYVVIEATVRSIGKGGSVTYLNFGSDYAVDLTVVIDRRTLARFPPEKSVEGLAGRKVRVRGWAERDRGAEIRLADPAALEWIEE